MTFDTDPDNDPGSADPYLSKLTPNSIQTSNRIHHNLHKGLQFATGTYTGTGIRSSVLKMHRLDLAKKT